MTHRRMAAKDFVSSHNTQTFTPTARLFTLTMALGGDVSGP